MLFNQDLENIIFHRHETHQSDELLILSGYLGPNPVARLEELPFNTTVIYGMYGDKGIQRRLHNALVTHQNNIENVNIYYSTVPIHSKCYIWKQNNNINHALIGSANFSTNGLCTPYREILAETTHDTYHPLNEYINRVMEHSRICTDIILPEQEIEVPGVIQISTQFCRVTLLDNNGQVQNASGLNWGYTKDGNKSPKRGENDTCLVIRKPHIQDYPHLFPPIQDYSPMFVEGARTQRKNDQVEIIWDDGTVMNGLLEGKQYENNIAYPKNFSSSPKKSIIGEYLRHRLGVALGARVTLLDLERYGRTHIDVSLQGEGIYFFDFSV